MLLLPISASSFSFTVFVFFNSWAALLTVYNNCYCWLYLHLFSFLCAADVWKPLDLLAKYNSSAATVRVIAIMNCYYSYRCCCYDYMALVLVVLSLLLLHLRLWRCCCSCPAIWLAITIVDPGGKCRVASGNINSTTTATATENVKRRRGALETVSKMLLIQLLCSCTYIFDFTFLL